MLILMNACSCVAADRLVRTPRAGAFIGYHN